MKGKMIATAAVSLLVSGSILAQSDFNRRQEREIIEILAEVGADCDRISRTQAVGRLPNNDTLVAIACASGGRYVILMDTRARMQWYSTCEALAEANNNLVRCFT